MAWFPKQNVVVPVDFSDNSFGAVDTALELVENASGLHLLYVLPDLDPTEPGVIWDTIDDQSRRQHAEKSFASRLADAKYQGIQVEIAFGDPGHEITEFAKRIEAELIVLPSHGRRGWDRLLLGSVAERVLRLAACPVLVLKV